MAFGIVMAGLTALFLTCVLVRYLSRPSLTKIRGPKSPSFIFGNLLELYQRPSGQTHIEWQRLYGDVVRFRSIFGEEELLVADPKALQQMLLTSPYHYQKEPGFRTICRALVGKGIGSAEGEDHARQKKVLLPGYGSMESKAYLEVFKRCADAMCNKWTEIIGNSKDQKPVIDISFWVSRGTLDVIGQAAFDVQFGAIKDDSHPLVKVYRNVLGDVLGSPSAQQLFIESAIKYVPTWLIKWMVEHGSNSRMQRAREVKRVVTEIATQLIHEKADALLASKGSRDIFSLLIKANMDAEAKNRLTDEELFSQMSEILLAGHETTSITLCWILFELARHPEAQSKLRAEIRRTEAAIRARHDTQFTVADFEAMPYTTAVIKEGLRLHPMASGVKRMAGGDGVLPLSRPVATESGELIDQIVVPKGTRIVASIISYNRIKELWGEDAHAFNPDRWLSGIAGEKKSVPVGVYSNLMTFLSGAHACLGFRFALIEIQVFLVEIIGRFELAMTKQSERIRPATSDFAIPTVEGEFGGQMPLFVSAVPREGDD